MGMDTSTILEAQASDLVGESVNLACMTILVGPIASNPKAPWWRCPSSYTDRPNEELREPKEACAQAQAGSAVPKRKRRCIGGLG